ncbi:MAG TPA: J domain-containing protein [Bryobacteraceae bacterium]|nr:J domain-containing protein [Bryobacteraceae bacterium]
MASFVDYYDLLQISPSAEPATVQRVHRMLAARYHPDNPETGDLDKFLLLQDAYRILSDPQTRAEYDVRLATQCQRPEPVFEAKEFVEGTEAETHRRLGVLCLLYNRRRSVPETPGLSLYDLEAKMSIPREHLDFAVWYLREKGFVRRDETSSEILITCSGVDFVEESQPANRIVMKLLKPARFESTWPESTVPSARESLPYDGRLSAQVKQ